MTTTSYNVDPQPNLVPAMDGKKVVFSREEPKAGEEPASEEPASEPKKSKGSDK